MSLDNLAFRDNVPAPMADADVLYVKLEVIFAFLWRRCCDNLRFDADHYDALDKPGEDESRPAERISLSSGRQAIKDTESSQADAVVSSQEDALDRESIIKFINDAGLLTYNVRQTRINDYLTSLYKLTRLLVQSRA